MLVVAPKQSNLEYVSHEIVEAVNELRAFLVITDDPAVVASEILKRNYEIIWFACHGDEGGIILSDTGYLSLGSLVPLLRDRGIRLIGLNSCNSERLAIALNKITGATIIYTESEAPDLTSFIVAKRFFFELKAGASYELAFRSAGTENFKMIGGSRMNDDKADEILSFIHKIDKNVSLIEYRQGSFDQRISALEANYNIGRRREPAYWWIIFIGLILATLLFISLAIVNLDGIQHFRQTGPISLSSLGWDLHLRSISDPR